MASWNKDRPDGAEAWDLGDDRIRDNFDFSEQALQALSTFAINPANPTDRIANKLLFGNTASRPVTTVAAQTGIFYCDTQALRVYLCTDGATNVWIEPFSSTDFFTVVSTLTAATANIAALQVSSSALFLSGITMGAGLFSMATTGRTQSVPPGENWLLEGASAMRPHLHAAARHRLTGSDGAWVAALDALGGLIGGVHTNVNTTPAVLGAAYSSHASLTRNFTGRGSATSKVLAIAQALVTGDSADTITCRVAMDGAASAFAPVCQRDVSAADVELLTVIDWFPGISAASHTFAVQLKRILQTPDHNESRLIVIDLGNQLIEGGI